MKTSNVELPRVVTYCALFACLLSAASADVLTLNATGDTYVRGDFPGTVYAADSDLWVGQLSDTKAIHALLSFDLTALPVNAVIDSVSLTLVQSAEDGSSFNTTLSVDLYGVSEDFTASQASWNNSATGDPWSTPGGTYDSTLLSSADVLTRPASNSVTLPATIAWSSTSDFIDYIQSAYDSNESTIGFLLKDSVEGSTGNDALRQFLKFSSSEGASTPQLSIAYSIPEFSSSAFLVGGLSCLFVFTRRSRNGRASLEA